MARFDLVDEARDEGHFADRLDAQQSRPQSVVDIVGIVGDVVGERGGLRFEAGVGHEVEFLLGVVGEDRFRYAARAPALGGLAVEAQHRAVVLDEAFERLLRRFRPSKSA